MANNKLEITLTRSVIGRQQAQKDTVKALGLNKIHQTVVHEDTPTIRGMVDKVSHLVTVSEA
ncbi:50S ribosomal protein L30 [Halalkalibacillus sediminis]|uniref:Large ribosomal subunit protein uL30 n=1 Tax=Halalkalibacillus sediminis TaxID=2018042 RepID=A0A2I0QQI5_9BACI|nr:50S ribosomal protein L30 [Halalkalibacillus sediminis]PKR76579.1 50S ribosomal protein L30 [Halalkalibacillus sediminis]